MSKVVLYDTTLRDGAQREGLSLSVEDKLKITLALDRLGLYYIEGGWPHPSNPKDTEYFRRMKKVTLKSAKLVSFGSTRRKNAKAEEDANLRALVKAKTPCVCIFGKSWALHVTTTLVTTLDENLKMIFDSVSFLKNQGLEVVYDAEHFFDAYKDDPSYALKTLKKAEEAGADWLVLCDTNGGTLPRDIKKIVSEVKKITKAPLGIHAHNDIECGVANSLEALEEGAEQIQGTMNGYGERCGNANLTSIIPNLILKMGIPVIDPERLSMLTEVSHHISEIANVAPNSHQPFVGESAFAHKAGVHVSALLRKKEAYEHTDPRIVGNVGHVLVSELSGTQTIIEKAKEIGVDLSGRSEKAADILKKLKMREHQGYHYEAADGSFALFLLKNTGSYRHLFELESFDVGVNRRRGGKFESDATVKLNVKGERVVEVAEGNGPVNALDRALRKALEPVYPRLSKMRLTDYKVRVLDEKKGTTAQVRVLIETADADRSWGTIGVSENIIEASWEALVDAIEYGLLYPSFTK